MNTDCTCNVLLVDDQHPVRILAEAMLLRLGYNVVSAPSAAAALQIAQQSGQSRIDLVLTDVCMPEMGGVELVSRLRSMLPDIRALLTSGHSASELVEDQRLPAGIPFLEKPFTFNTLAEKIQEALKLPATPAAVGGTGFSNN